MPASTSGTPINRILATVLRASIDLCWLLPLAHVLGITASGPPVAVVHPLVVIWLIFFTAGGGAVVGGLPAGHPLVSRRLIPAASAVQLVGFWFLQHRWIFVDLPVDSLLLSDQFPVLLISLGYLILVMWRGMTAGSNPQHIYYWDIIRSAVLTVTMLLLLKYSAGSFPLWPVLWLLPATVASAVFSRASLIAPSPSASRLSWAGRTVTVAALLTAAVLFGLFITALSSPDFWTAVGHLLLQAWLVIANIITYLMYPLAYAAFWVYGLITRYMPAEGEPPDLQLPDEPLQPDDHVTSPPVDGSALSIILRLIALAAMAGILVYIIRSMRNRERHLEETPWTEERESLWNPDNLRKKLLQVFRTSTSTTDYTYRTDTERKIRAMYRGLQQQLKSTCASTASQTPRRWAEELLNCVPRLSEAGRDGLHALIGAYERVRYGPPLQDEQLVQQARSGLETFRAEYDG